VAEVFEPGSSAAASSERFPERWDVIHAIDQGRARGRDLRVLYIQNSVDHFHHERHFAPFCKHFGVPIEGGASADGKILAHLYESPDGHAAESPDVVKYIVSAGLDHLNR
jgi:hypothetical protein